MANSNPELILPPPAPNWFDNNSQYKYHHTIWQRTGGYQNNIYNLQGLKASVKELNTLVGISTNRSVQDQLDLKEDKANLKTMAYQNANDVDISGGVINGVTIGNSTITINIGASGLPRYLGATIVNNVTAVGNIGVGEDNLITYSLLANSLSSTADYIEIRAYGTFASNANNKRVKLYFGTATLIDTGVVAANSGSWIIDSTISRITSASELAISKIISDNTLVTDGSSFVAATQNLAGNITIKCTGEGVATDDIIQKGLIIKWFKGA